MPAPLRSHPRAWRTAAGLVLLVAVLLVPTSAARPKIDPDQGADWFWNVTRFEGSQELTWSVTETELLGRCEDGSDEVTTVTGSGSFRVRFATTERRRFAAVYNRPDILVGSGFFVALGRSVSLNRFEDWGIPATAELTGALTTTNRRCPGLSAPPPRSAPVDGCGTHAVRLGVSNEPGALDRSGLLLRGYLRYPADRVACPSIDDAADELIVDLQTCADYRRKAPDALAENASLVSHRLRVDRARLARPRGRTLRLPGRETLRCTYERQPTSTDSGSSRPAYRLEVSGQLQDTITLVRRANRAKVR